MSNPETAVTASPPNKSNCPIASARFDSITESIASKWMAINPLREDPSDPKAPALISDSIVFLLHT